MKFRERENHKGLILYDITFDTEGTPMHQIYLDACSDWIDKINTIEIPKECIVNEQYAKPFDEANSVHVYSPDKDQVVAVVTNISEVIQSKKNLLKQYELLETTFLSLREGVISVDLDNKVTMMSHIAEKMTGWTKEEAIGKPLDDVFVIVGYGLDCDDENENVNENVNVNDDEDVLVDPDNTEQEYKTEEKFLVDRTKHMHAIEECIAPIKDDACNIYGKVIVFRDITEKLNRIKHIEYLSYHDQLTGLYNRRFFDEELKRIDTERNLPLSLVMLDVNGLKLTNDAFGHHMGDLLLKKVANILKNEFRADDIVARIGGDEFVVLLPSTSREELMPILERVKYAAEHTKFENSVLSFSAGSETKMKQYENIMEVFSRAENEMYRNKLIEGKTIRSRTIQMILSALSDKCARNKIQHLHVKHWCTMVGEALHFTQSELNELDVAALVYDIGKISISDDLLSKPDKLTESEYEKIKKHPEVGYQILKSVDHYANFAEYALTYHERWNGSGYPRKLFGEQIPRFSRIIAVADTYEALISERPYRPAMPPCNALEYIQSQSDIAFDASIVNAFISQVTKEDNPCNQS